MHNRVDAKVMSQIQKKAMSWSKVTIIMKLCISYKHLEVMHNNVQVVRRIGGNEGSKNYNPGLPYNIVVDKTQSFLLTVCIPVDIKNNDFIFKA